MEMSNSLHSPSPEPATASTPWHDYDWGAVLRGQCTSDRIFLRAGLVRKDRLALYVPARHHPETSVLRSFVELGEALDISCRAPRIEEESSIRFVLKKAQSSNAFGMRFLSLRDAQAVVRLAQSSSVFGSMASVDLSNTLVAALSIVVASSLSIVSCFRRHCKRVPIIGALELSILATGLASLVLSRRFIFADGSQPSRSSALEIQSLFSQKGTKTAREEDIWILQKHIRPWLYKGRKFHLRALLLCIGDLQAWLHEDVRVLLATELFEAGCNDGNCTSALVTNMGASSKHSGYDVAAQNLPLSALGAEMAQSILESACQVLGSTLDNVKQAGRRQFFTLPNCWELFGVDLLVEDTGCVYLLEVNPSPSMAMYGGPSSREVLVGRDPLNDSLPSGWNRVPLRDDRDK